MNNEPNPNPEPAGGEPSISSLVTLQEGESIFDAIRRTVREVEALRRELTEAKEAYGLLDISWRTTHDAATARLREVEGDLRAVLYLAVDKWFDNNDPILKENPATRAGRAREVALQAIEAAESQLLTINEAAARELEGEPDFDATEQDMRLDWLNVQNKELAQRLGVLAWQLVEKEEQNKQWEQGYNLMERDEEESYQVRDAAIKRAEAAEAQNVRLREALEKCCSDIEFWSDILDKEWSNFDGQLNPAFNLGKRILSETASAPASAPVENRTATETAINIKNVNLQLFGREDLPTPEPVEAPEPETADVEWSPTTGLRFLKPQPPNDAERPVDLDALEKVVDAGVPLLKNASLQLITELRSLRAQLESARETKEQMIGFLEGLKCALSAASELFDKECLKNKNAMMTGNSQYHFCAGSIDEFLQALAATPAPGQEVGKDE